MDINFYFKKYDTAKNTFFKVLKGASQAGYSIGMPKEPELVQGPGCVKKLPEALSKNRISNILIVADKGAAPQLLLDSLLKPLDENHIAYTVYDKVDGNPTIENVGEAAKIYKKNACEAVVGFGTGAIDCAKATAAKVATGINDIRHLYGLFKLSASTPVNMPPVVAVPTAGGSTAENNIYAAVYDTENKICNFMTDFALRPRITVLDPELTLGLNASETAAAGMEALARAVEAYISFSFFPAEKNYAKKAVKLIFDNIECAVENTQDLPSKNKLLYASYYAGLSASQGLLGYVYPMSHSISAATKIPSGVASAVCLPYVLEWYGSAINRPLAQLADEIGMTNNSQFDDEKAKLFISQIKLLNQKFNIPSNINDLKEDRIPLTAVKILMDAHPFYPVPKNMRKADCIKILKDIKG